MTAALRNAGNNEIVQHGACLGLGLTAMATNRMDIYEILKVKCQSIIFSLVVSSLVCQGLVFTDNAVAGEAGGLAIGLVFMGSGNGEALEEMVRYAHETQHEKIIREWRGCNR